MFGVSNNHPLRRFFAGAVENVFCTEIGLCDPLLTDYLADVLVGFTHIDEADLLIDTEWKRIEHVAAMLSVALGAGLENGPAPDCQAYRHIGDYSLFWTGVYPERLRQARRDRPDVLTAYLAQGKQSYAIAAELAEDDFEVPPSLLNHLSENFECCVHGLGLVRRGWEESATGVEAHCGELLR